MTNIIPSCSIETGCGRNRKKHQRHNHGKRQIQKNIAQRFEDRGAFFHHQTNNRTNHNRDNENKRKAVRFQKRPFRHGMALNYL